MTRRKEPKPQLGLAEATLARRRKTIERRIAVLQQEMGRYAGLEIELKAHEGELAEIDEAIEAVRRT